MHEMGVVLSIVRAAEKTAKANRAAGIGRLVLEVGELTGVVPRYVRACWPAAVEGTMLAGAELVIEEIPGNGVCCACGKVFNLLQNDAPCEHSDCAGHHVHCPACGGMEYDVVSGGSVMIREIAVYD